MKLIICVDLEKEFDNAWSVVLGHRDNFTCF